MPQYNKKNKKAASGMGNIRKVTKIKNGKEYTYYEARYTEGYDPGTGKQIQRSITGKTQKEVAQKLKAVLSSIDRGDYIAPCKMTVGEWLDKWSTDFNRLSWLCETSNCMCIQSYNQHPLEAGTWHCAIECAGTAHHPKLLQRPPIPKKEGEGSFTQDSEKHPWRATQGSAAGSIQWVYPHKPDRCLCSSPC